MTFSSPWQALAASILIVVARAREERCSFSEAFRLTKRRIEHRIDRKRRKGVLVPLKPLNQRPNRHARRKMEAAMR